VTCVYDLIRECGATAYILSHSLSAIQSIDNRHRYTIVHAQKTDSFVSRVSYLYHSDQTYQYSSTCMITRKLVADKYTKDTAYTRYIKVKFPHKLISLSKLFLISPMILLWNHGGGHGMIISRADIPTTLYLQLRVKYYFLPNVTLEYRTAGFYYMIPC